MPDKCEWVRAGKQRFTLAVNKWIKSNVVDDHTIQPWSARRLLSANTALAHVKWILQESWREKRNGSAAVEIILMWWGQRKHPRIHWTQQNRGEKRSVSFFVFKPKLSSDQKCHISMEDVSCVPSGLNTCKILLCPIMHCVPGILIKLTTVNDNVSFSSGSTDIHVKP